DAGGGLISLQGIYIGIYACQYLSFGNTIAFLYRQFSYFTTDIRTDLYLVLGIDLSAGCDGFRNRAGGCHFGGNQYISLALFYVYIYHKSRTENRSANN